MSPRIIRLCIALAVISSGCGTSSKKDHGSDSRDAGHGFRDDDGDSGTSSTRDAGHGGHMGLDGGSHQGDDDGGTPQKDGGTGVQNKARVVSVAPTYTVANDTYKYSPKSSSSGNTMWKVKDGPSGMTTEDDGATVAWTPSKDQGGAHKVTLEGKTNDSAETVQQTTTVTVAVPKKLAETSATTDEGGTANVASPTSKIQGAGVTIPKAALSSNQTVTVSELDKAPHMGNQKGSSLPVEFGPSGTKFNIAALVALPLPADVQFDTRRLGGFFYDTHGRWQRLSTVRADLDHRLLYVRAAHFCTLMGAQSALGLELALMRMNGSSACEGALAGESVLSESLGEVDADSINNPSEELRARIEGGSTDIASVIGTPGFSGSLRFVRVTDLVQGTGDDAIQLEENVLAATLYLPGDGSATITHTTSLGHVLGTSSFADVSASLNQIGAELRGEATRALFASTATGPLSLSGRLYIVYYEGDASLDPVSVDDLGVAAVDQGAADVEDPGTETGNLDGDCDEVVGSFDPSDDRLSPRVVGTPADVIATTVGTSVALTAELVNAQASLTWQVLSGDGQLSTDANDARVRNFKGNSVGRQQVEARAKVGSQLYSFVFTIDVGAKATPPSCTPGAAITSLKQGESATLSALLGDSRLPMSALSIGWGLVRDGEFQPSDELSAAGDHVVFTPRSEGTYVVACRAADGTTNGDTGSVTLSVLPVDANRLPVDLTLSPASTTILVDQVLNLVATGSDPDHENLGFSWATSGGTLGAPAGDGVHSQIDFTSSAPGLFDVSVAITDAAGLPQTLHASVLVIPDQAALAAKDEDGDGWPASLDCDDHDKARNPAARDACGNDVDEDCSGTPRTTDCDFDGQSEADGDCNDQKASIHTGAPELCDGIDNDCNGKNDDGFNVGASCSSGIGACASAGSFVCTPSGGSTVCNAHAGVPHLEVCNGVDDDCDGQRDEDYVTKATSCGVGACASTGLRSCIQGSEVDTCLPGQAAPTDNVCNNIDDDCDGKKDEDFVPAVTTCGTGVCAAIGATSCSSGKVSDSCKVGVAQSSDTTCNALDDDCDGQVDEDYVVSVTSCGIGACAAYGQATCLAGTVRNSCAPGVAAALDNSCDGIDEDCNGQVDEDFMSLLEVCNGLDDDCDGTPDEGLTCAPTQPPASCQPSGTEICNGRDDDCNGKVDEGACGFVLAADSVAGMWWVCADPACNTLADTGLMFTNSGELYFMGNPSGTNYDPTRGSYCAKDDHGTYDVVGTTLTLHWMENGTPDSTDGSLLLQGMQAVIHWSTPPGDSPPVLYLKRVPEQSSGQCAVGPACQPTEICGNGFDDNCDGRVDYQDPQCMACKPSDGQMLVEVCDGKDNDCDGIIDDLAGTCAADALGQCGVGHPVCNPGGDPTCQATLPDAAGEVCPDGRDNDCDGQTDEDGCTPLSPGETCFNPIDISAGGVFVSTLGLRDDAFGCMGGNANDRMFMFQVPQGLGSEYTIGVQGAQQVFLSASLVQMPAGWTPAAGCPAQQQQQQQGTQQVLDARMCMGSSSGTSGMFKQYLSPGSTYLLMIEGKNEELPDQPGNDQIRVSIARRSDGICTPGDEDGDGTTLCDGDCDDSQSSVHQGAAEACNGVDDNCNGQIDEQFGTCDTGMVGACAQGLPTCAGGLVCQPINLASSADYCGDSTDNDCNGQVDDSCVNAPGEACSNAIDIGFGGTFSGSLTTAHDDAISRCMYGAGTSGPELFYRFHVPGTGAQLIMHAQGVGEIRYVLYRNCNLDVIDCYLEGNGRGRYLEPGDYLIAIEQDIKDINAPRDYAFTLGLQGQEGGNCITPDLDGDGFNVCQLDCDESNTAINPNGSEGAVCDHLDNDCNGMADDLHAPCNVAGQLGYCAQGELRCDPSGGTSCAQIHLPDAQGRDICGDGVDNDCDGQTDDADPQSCVALPPGDICAMPVDVGAGGMFTGTLVGYSDDDSVGCGDGGTSDGKNTNVAGVVGDGNPPPPPVSGGIERFYSITLSEPRRLHAAARTSDPTMGVGMALLNGCGSNRMSYCQGGNIDLDLPAGTYLIALFSGTPVDYQFAVATTLPGDFEGTSCSPGDLDSDGYTLCNGDCNENSAAAHPGAFEQCDGVDNNCDGRIDENIVGPSCNVAGAQGECVFGMNTCQNGAMQCTPNVLPGQNPEVCNDGRDNDCDGLADDTGSPGVDCLVANGDTCTLAMPLQPGGYTSDTLAGAQDNGKGCYGGITGQAPEKYYRFDAPSSGYGTLRIQPHDPVHAPQFAVGVFDSGCGDEHQLGCAGSETLHFFINNPGPHYIVVESDMPFDYEIEFAFSNQPGEDCTPFDVDHDGTTLCNGDCNDDDARAFPGSSEVCDGVDNDCDGVTDDIPSGPCATEMPGVCAQGHMACVPGGQACVPNTPARANDVCGDGQDNDCDGLTDEPDCDALPPGELCGIGINVSGGGSFPSSLAGRNDDGIHCGPQGSPDVYFSFTLTQQANVYFDVQPLASQPTGPMQLSAHLFGTCDELNGFACVYPRLDGYSLSPGTYSVAVEGNQPIDFLFQIAFDTGTGCMAGGAGADFDHDGAALCYDCNDSDASIYPGATELCGNQRDDNCDGYTDSLPASPCQSGQAGDCGPGHLECQGASGTPVCIPNVQPNSRPELCGDGIDNDCSDGIDEPACVPPTGATCELALTLDGNNSGQTTGTITDPRDDAPGCDDFSAEVVYRLDVPFTSYLFVQATDASGGNAQFTVRSSEDNCFGPYQCHGSNDQGAFVTGGKTYYLTVQGPPQIPFTLRWAFRPGESPYFGECLPGGNSQGNADFDGDGVSLCDHDCNESQASVFPGALEICGNNLDDNCDGNTDMVFGNCDTGLPGECSTGILECDVSGEPASCVTHYDPSPEMCNGLDDNCNGQVDEGACL